MQIFILDKPDVFKIENIEIDTIDKIILRRYSTVW